MEHRLDKCLIHVEYHLIVVLVAVLGKTSPQLTEVGRNLPMWTEIECLLIMLQSPQEHTWIIILEPVLNTSINLWKKE